MSDFPVPFLPKYKFKDELIATAKKIATPGKGILAADESTGTIASRFKGIGVENNLANRTEYRRLLFSTPGLGDHVSGAILFEETLFAKGDDGRPLVDHLKDHDIMIGIKVDKGTKTLPGSEGELYTQGLTDLDQRCKKYYEAGARFSKWRAVVSISRSTPSPYAIQETAWSLARYAAICQDNGLVPIVEPEILMDGSHTIEVCAYWTEKVVAACYTALIAQNVLLEGTLLKPNMVVPGADCPKKATKEEIAYYTVRSLQRSVPPAVPGITFLSGGQSEIEATANLNAINGLSLGPRPWSLSFSYGRALQQSCLKAWKGKKENVVAAQKVLYHRTRSNGLAQLGKYTGEEMQGSGQDSLYQKKYTY